MTLPHHRTCGLPHPAVEPLEILRAPGSPGGGLASRLLVREGVPLPFPLRANPGSDKDVELRRRRKVQHLLKIGHEVDLAATLKGIHALLGGDYNITC